MHNRTIKSLYLLGVICMGSLAGGCADRRAWTVQDSWFNPPPATESHDSTPLEGSRIDLVMDTKEAAAERMLAGASYVPITDDQAKDLIGLPIRPYPGTQPYLVRGVSLGKRAELFDVFELKDDDILVFSNCMGHAAAPMRRQALVVQLAQPPRQVFVLCRMSE